MEITKQALSLQQVVDIILAALHDVLEGVAAEATPALDELSLIHISNHCTV